MREPIGPESQDLADTVFEGRGLTKEYRVRHHGRDAYHGRHQTLVAVNDVTLSLPGREVTAVVGESGSGKSTLARLMAALESPTRGELWLGDQHIRLRGARQMRPFRRKCSDDLPRPLRLVEPGPHHRLPPGAATCHPRPGVGQGGGGDRDRTPLGQGQPRPCSPVPRPLPPRALGWSAPAGRHRPRLAVQPQVLLADEPVSMLDVSIRMGVLMISWPISARNRVWPFSTSPTTSPQLATSPTPCRSCTPVDWSRAARPKTSPRSQRTLTPKCLSMQRPTPTGCSAAVA